MKGSERQEDAGWVVQSKLRDADLASAGEFRRLELEFQSQSEKLDSLSQFTSGLFQQPGRIYDL